MGCGSCGTASGGSKVGGCGSNNGCSTGGCNRLNVYDWLSDIPQAAERDKFNLIEVSFKNGARKAFFTRPKYVHCITGDMVVVESQTVGYDIGKVSLSGELVRLQMRKKRISENSTKIKKVVRIANERDMEKYQYAKSREYETMVLARVIARDLGLNMKIGDVEFQGDGRKATFYYTADGRVDFRELIKLFARDFQVKIEMRQIGTRQEAGRIGGIGSCGRELCCSTWLSDFKTVSTSIARYQNLSINQTKLSGQCGRLKCCLNYELDTYLDALKAFPKNVDEIKTKQGKARLIKTDIFKQKMWYAFPQSPMVELTVERVKEIKELNIEGKYPDTLKYNEEAMAILQIEREKEHRDLVGQTNLDELQKLDNRIKNRKRRQKRRESDKPSNRRTPSNRGGGQGNKPKTNNPSSEKKSGQGSSSRSSSNRRGGSNRPPSNKRTDNRNNNPNKKRTDGKPNNRPPSNKPRRDSNTNDNRNKPKVNKPLPKNRPNNKPNDKGGNNKNTDSKKD